MGKKSSNFEGIWNTLGGNHIFSIIFWGKTKKKYSMMTFMLIIRIRRYSMMKKYFSCVLNLSCDKIVLKFVLFSVKNALVFFRVLLRVRMLYYIKHEIIGDLVQHITDGVHVR